MELLIRYICADVCLNLLVLTFFLALQKFVDVFFFFIQTILGDFQKEQERFVQENKARKPGKY